MIEKSKKIHTEGDRQLEVQRSILTKKMKLLNQQHQEALKEEEAKFNDDLLASKEKFEKTKTNNNRVYKLELANQKSEFLKTYRINDAHNRQALKTQRTQIANALNQQKQELTQSMGQFLEKSEDPFYNPLKIQTQLTETGNAYILKAEIPEKEKDNIDIRIQKDKIILQGNREYKEEIKSQRGANTH